MIVVFSSLIYYTPGNWHIPSQGTFEDDFLCPKVENARFLEGFLNQGDQLMVNWWFGARRFGFWKVSPSVSVGLGFFEGTFTGISNHQFTPNHQFTKKHPRSQLTFLTPPKKMGAVCIFSMDVSPFPFKKRGVFCCQSLVTFRGVFWGSILRHCRSNGQIPGRSGIHGGTDRA